MRLGERLGDRVRPRDNFLIAHLCPYMTIFFQTDGQICSNAPSALVSGLRFTKSNKTRPIQIWAAHAASPLRAPCRDLHCDAQDGRPSSTKSRSEGALIVPASCFARARVPATMLLGTNVTIATHITRADEPMTTFLFCGDCQHRWTDGDH